jgi:hypothetical protein
MQVFLGVQVFLGIQMNTLCRLLLSFLLLTMFSGNCCHCYGTGLDPPAKFMPPPCDASFAEQLPSWLMFSLTNEVACDPAFDKHCTTPILISSPAYFLSNTSTYHVPLPLANPQDGYDDAYISVRWSLGFPITNHTDNTTDVQVWRRGESYGNPVWILAGNQITPSVYEYEMDVFNPDDDSWPDHYVNNENVAWTTKGVALLRIGDNTAGSCLLTFNVDVTCCSAIQPPQVSFQPYFILAASSVAYFFMSYLWVFIMTLMDRFVCWRRCCWNIRRKLGRNETLVYRRVPRDKKKQQQLLMEREMRISPQHSHDAHDTLKAPLLSNEAPSVIVYNQTFVVAAGSIQQATSSSSSPPPSTSFQGFHQGGIGSSSFSDDTDEIDPADLEDTQGEATGQVVSSTTFHPDAVPVQTMAERLANANSWYLSFQFLVVLGNLVFLHVREIWLDPSPTDQGRNPWEIYQSIFLLWTNSSQVTLLSSAVASYLLLKYQVYATLESKGQLPPPSKHTWYGKAICCLMCCCCCTCCSRVWQRFKVFWKLLPQSKATKRIAQLVLLLNIPIFFTHILPIWFLFSPLLILVLLVLSGLALLMLGVLQLTQKGASKIFSLTSIGALAAWDAVAQAAKEYRKRKEEEEKVQREREEAEAQGLVYQAEREEKSALTSVLGGKPIGAPVDEIDEPSKVSNDDPEWMHAPLSPTELPPSSCDSIIPMPYAGPSSSSAAASASGPSAEEQRLRLEELIRIATAASQPDLPALGEPAEVDAAAKVAERDMQDGLLTEASLASPAALPKAVVVEVEFPWYAVLLLRLMCTICAVVLMQTTYNYGWIFWTRVYPHLSDEVTDWNSFGKNVWASIATTEFELRSVENWWNGMQASFHQYLMQISLFV